MNPFQTTTGEGVCILAAKHFRQQAKRLAAQLDGIRAAEDIECVHRARVASRRLRAGLRMFQTHLEPEVYARWRKYVRRVTSGLGDARDKDVQIEVLCRALSRLDDALLVPAVARLLAGLEKQRERLQPKVVKAVDRIERSGVLDEMRTALKEVRSRSDSAKAEPGGPAVFREAAERIHAQLDELLSHESSLADPQAVAEHHAMRIAAKRLRYTLEIVAAPYRRALDGMIEMTRRAQTLLGDIHDCDVWAERLDAFAEKQRARVVKRFGHEGPYARLAVGIEWLRGARARDRQRLFGELVDFWGQRKRQGDWDQLRRLAAGPGESPAAAAPSANGSARVERPGDGAERDVGRSVEASLAACVEDRES